MIESKYQIVTNNYVMSFIKKSNYFQTNLGVAITMERNGERLLNEGDKFAGSYNMQYKTSIFAQGTIGDIFFYVDYGIVDNTVAAYHQLEEFVFEFDEKMVQEKGISAYLGFILKNIDTEYARRKGIEVQKQESKEVNGYADKLFSNPGAVTYDDIKAYLQQKRL